MLKQLTIAATLIIAIPAQASYTNTITPQEYMHSLSLTYESTNHKSTNQKWERTVEGTQYILSVNKQKLLKQEKRFTFEYIFDVQNLNQAMLIVEWHAEDRKPCPKYRVIEYSKNKYWISEPFGNCREPTTTQIDDNLLFTFDNNVEYTYSKHKLEKTKR